MALNYHPHAVLYNLDIDETAVMAALDEVDVALIGSTLPSRGWLAEDIQVPSILGKPVSVEAIRTACEPLPQAATLLVVDDDRGFIQLIERIVSAFRPDIAIFHAFDGIEGVEAMRDHHPHLVFLDLQMPEANGYQTLEMMRNDRDLKTIPVILITAHNLAEEALESGQGRIAVNRPGGMHMNEILQCVEAIADVMEPQFEAQSTAPPDLFTDMLRGMPPMDVRFPQR